MNRHLFSATSSSMLLRIGLIQNGFWNHVRICAFAGYSALSKVLEIVMVAL